jgi:hypothetical protein
MPETESTPATESQPQQPQPQNPINKPRRCRYIKTAGDQCRARAMTGNHYCFSHKFNSKPTLTGVRGYDRVAFLEDAASIQLILSQAMQGLLDRTLDHHAARSMFYGCAVATGLVRLDMMNQRWLAENKQPFPEQVTETTKAEDSEPLGVDEEYRGPTGVFEPQWSFSKYLYEKDCEELGQIKPTCAADFPASGWLTEDEIKEDPQDWIKRTKGRKLALYEKCKAAEKAANPERFYIPSPESKPEPSIKPNSGPGSEPGTEPGTEPKSEPDPKPSTEPSTKPSAETNPDPRDKNNPVAPKSTEPHRTNQPCPCGGLYGGDPCDDCLDRQQRNAPPAQDRSAFSASFDLKASTEVERCSSERCAEPCAPNAQCCPGETCTLHPVPCTLPFEVPEKKSYPPTSTKQDACGNNPSPRVAAHATIAELRRLILSGLANRIPRLGHFLEL